MNGEFELNKPGWYTPKIVQENGFLNEKLTTDQYGIYYSVQFDGDADTYLWQAKTAPATGEKVWGHVEKSASGKSMRFKKDKLEGTPATSGGAQPYQNTSNNITLGLVYKIVAGIRGLPEPNNPADKSVFWEMVKEHTEELISIGEMLNSDKTLAQEAEKAFPEDE